MRNFTDRRLSIATSESRIIAFSLEYMDRRLENMICLSARREGLTG